MMFLQKFTGHGGGCATTTFFYMFCSCMSEFRHEGQPGGCEDCRNKHKVYDKQGLQICLHHDVVTPERLLAQRARLVHLKDKRSGTFPLRKKPAWENLHGLRQACLDRCIPGVTNKDGHTLSNSVIVGVHHIGKERLLLELNMRRIPIPIRGKSNVYTQRLLTSHGCGFSWCTRREVQLRARQCRDFSAWISLNL